MVLLTMTDAIVKALKKLETQPGKYGARKDVPDPPPMPSILEPSIGKPISHSQIINISSQLQSIGHPSYHLDTLLLGSRVYIPPRPPAPEPTPEYKALMARLRREAESRAYDRMTRPAPAPHDHFSSSAFPFNTTSSPSAAFSSSSPDDDGDDDSLTYNDVTRQTTLIFNILLSIFACGAALWTVARWWDTPARLLLSMGGGVVVGVAEVVVYAGYLRRLGEARRKERAVREVKEVARTWVVGGGDKGVEVGGEGEGDDGDEDGKDKGGGVEGFEALGSREGQERRTTGGTLRERKWQKGLAD